MSQHNRQNPRTAEASRSIWRDISEETFRTHMVSLEERTNAVVVPPQVFSVSEFPRSLAEETHLLPLTVEQRVADDLAYLYAVGEGAQSVSAVCIEEHLSPTRLIIRIASVDAVGDKVRDALQQLGALLERAAGPTSLGKSAETADALLKLVVSLHYQKLLGRLRSGKWQKPKYLSRTHKKSLLQDFDNLSHRVQFVYPKKRDSTRSIVEERIVALAAEFKQFEVVSAKSPDEATYLLQVVTASYRFCQVPEVKDFAAKLDIVSNTTSSQIAAAIKTLRQVEKIGAYQRIVFALVKTAEEYSVLFRSIDIRFMRPYSAVDTDVGFESWAKSMHVHAEVQLMIHYDLLSVQSHLLSSSTESHYQQPRVIGTSKYLCYMCFLFMSEHDLFVASNTHGRLYDQWTIPDLAEYDDHTVQRYRKIISAIDSKVSRLSDEIGHKEGKRDAWRVEPMTSRQNLLLAPNPDESLPVLTDMVADMSIT